MTAEEIVKVGAGAAPTAGNKADTAAADATAAAAATTAIATTAPAKAKAKQSEKVRELNIYFGSC